MHLRPRPSPLQRLIHPAATTTGVRLYAKRDDLYTLAPGTALQGNKVRKLLPVITAALGEASPPLLLSFGGAYSNHLSALATAGRLYGLPVAIGVRGEEVRNPVLERAQADGARLYFLSRTDYRRKHDAAWLSTFRERIAIEIGFSPARVWVIPEGGTSPEGVREVGSVYREIVAQLGRPPEVLCLSAGTGGTATGIIQAADPMTRVEVFPALKGDWMTGAITDLLDTGASVNWTCVTDFHFGGYGKFPRGWVVPSEGLATRANLKEVGLPPLEPVYTAKLFAGVLSGLRAGRYQRGASLVVLHTGGIY